MENGEGAFIEEWPRVSFEEISSCQEEGAVGVFYKSFFSLLRLPETVISSLFTLFTERID